MLKRFQRIVVQKKGHSFYQETLETAILQYEFLLNSLESFPKKQHKALLRFVFPILSMYQSFKIHQLSTEETLLLIEMILKDSFSLQLKGIQFLNKLLPNPFLVIRPFLQWSMKFSDLPNGQEIIKNDKNCFAFNVNQCFINDAMEEFNAPELTTVFCATDDWLSAAMPKIDWKRTQTLGRGGDHCDFSWCRKQQKTH